MAKVAKDDPDGCNLSSNFSNFSQPLAANQNQAAFNPNKDLSPTLATLAVATDQHHKTQLLKGISKTESDELSLATVAKVATDAPPSLNPESSKKPPEVATLPDQLPIKFSQ